MLGVVGQQCLANNVASIYTGLYASTPWTLLVFFCHVFSKWTPEDDKLLLDVVRVVGVGNWARGTFIKINRSF